MEAFSVTNLKLAGRGASVSEKWLVFFVTERDQGDLNGDGDFNDKVLHVYDLESGTTTVLMGSSVGNSGKWLGFVDASWVLHVYNLESGTTTNLNLVVQSGPEFRGAGDACHGGMSLFSTDLAIDFAHGRTS